MFKYLLILLSTLLLPLLALAQAATQPASQPAAPQAFLAWFKAWWPVTYSLLVILVATAITVMTKYKPDAKSVIGALQILADCLSLWGNRDSPTGPNLPFLRSKPPVNGTPAAKSPPLAPVTTLLLTIMLCLTLSGCCVFRHDCKSKPGQTATLVVDCTIEAVKTLATEMLPAVVAIITSGGSNWAMLLDQLKGAGFDALACSLQQAGQEVQNMSLKSGPVETHYLIKMKVPPVETQARVSKYLSAMKTAKGQDVRVEFKKVSP